MKWNYGKDNHEAKDENLSHKKYDKKIEQIVRFGFVPSEQKISKELPLNGSSVQFYTDARKY